MRSYDDSDGRFTSIDPLWESFRSWSPYQYSYDNPLTYQDPSGFGPFDKAAEWAVRFLSSESGGGGPMGASFSNPYGGGERKDELSGFNTDKARLMEKSFNSTNFEKAQSKTVNTESRTAKEALGKAKEANGIPRSQQPDNTIKPNTPEGKKAGLDNRNVKQYDYTNSKGEKVSIRQDKAVTYPDGGTQGKHLNAGKAGQKLEQHHYYIK